MAASRSVEQTCREVDLIERLLALPKRSAVLDVPCGTGRVALELARRGHAVTAVDHDRAVFDAARHDATERRLGIEWHVGDMREMPWNDRFRAAVCLWGSFGYLGDDGNRRFLEAIARCLEPHGAFVMDTPTVESVLRHFTPRTWKQVGDAYVLQEKRYDATTGYLERRWITVSGGAHHERSTRMRLYTTRELVALLSAAGFLRAECFGGFDGRPPSVDDERIVVVATR
jgi:SAM-dependent methyltransferase